MCIRDRAIGITEYISSGIQEKVQNARDTGQDYSYFANEYIISCKPRRSPNLLSPGTLFGFFPKVDLSLIHILLYSFPPTVGLPWETMKC